MSNNYELNILSGLLSDKIRTLKQQIKHTYFKDRTQSQLFKFCVNFYNETKTAPTATVVRDGFKDSLEDVKQELEFLLNQLNPNIDSALFEHSLKAFLTNYKVSVLEDMRQNMADIYSRGVEKTLEDVSRAVTTIKSVENNFQKIYYTDSREDNDNFLTELKNPIDEVEGIPTSNPTINALTGGMKPKSFWIIAGAPGECKSTQLINFAYDCLISGKNTFYCTVEMSEKDVKSIIWALHVYRQYGYVIDTQSIRSPKMLSSKDLEYLERAKADLDKLPGRIIVFELPQRYSFSNLESKLMEENEKRTVDAVFLDYLLLLRPDEKRVQKHEEDEQMFKDAKQLANTFDNSRGIFLCTAHQINTEGMKKARKRGHYEFEDFAKTAEARNSPDFAISNWLDDTLREQNEIKQRVHKNRYGKLNEMWVCPTELSCSAINPPISFDECVPESIKLD